ncbi:BamA/OMP85 family outer membrane protein [Thermovibrio sp.]
MGYPEPEVNLSFKKLNCGYLLSVNVKKGYRLYISKVVLVAPPFIRKELLKLLSSLKGSAVNYDALREVKDKIEELLIDKGFYNCRVNLSVVPQRKRGFNLASFLNASLLVKVEPGKRYEVIFKGNKHFPFKELLKLTTFKSARSFDEFELENSKRNILSFYRSRGFPFVKVGVSVKEGEKVVKVIFLIKEGPFVVVKEVSSLDYKLPNKYIKRLIGKPFNYREIEKIKDEILSSLKGKGYLQASFEYRVSPKGELLLKVNRGPLFKVVSFKVVGDKLKCFKPPSVPSPLTPSLVSQITDSISSCYLNRGYPEVKVKVERELLKATESGKEFTLKVVVEPGSFYKFCFVLVRGLKRTKLSSIKNLLVIKPGDVFSNRELFKQYSLLLESRLFSSISLKEFKGKRCFNELITLKEGSLLKFKGFLGYGTDSGYVVNAFASSTSPLGLGIKYILFGNYRQKEGYDMVFRALKPQFPFKRYDSTYSIVKKKQIFESFKVNRTYYEFSLRRKASRNLTQNFSFKVLKSTLTDTSINTKRETLERLLSYTHLYDKRDNISNPHSGYILKTTLSVSGFVFGGDTSYYLVNSRFKYLYPLSRKSVLSLRLGVGFIESLRNKVVPVEDRFFLGGAESVRGYKYGTISPTDEKGNFIGGRAYGLFSLELRRLLWSNIEGALFYDSGKVFPYPKDFSLTNWYSSVGFGIRYLTPVGPLRIDYGYKLKKVPGQGRGRVHISFGFPF